MNRTTESPLPPSASIGSRAMLRVLWAIALLAGLLYGPALAQGIELGDQDWEPPVWMANVAGGWRSLSRGVMLGHVGEWLGDGRDSFYGGFPVVAAVESGPAVPEEPPTEPADFVAEAAPEAPVAAGSGALDLSAAGSGSGSAAVAAAEVVEPGEPAEATQPAEPQVAQADGRFRPSRVLVVGASSIQFELGRELEEAFERDPGLTVRRDGRHSTGLARIDYFNWLEQARTLVSEFDPDLVIAQVGGNDCQGITDVDGDAVARWNDEEAWVENYHARVAEFVTIFRDSGARVVVVGMPIMRSPGYRAKMERLNRVTREAVEEAGEWYISTWEMTSSPGGEYLEEMEIDGRTRVFRADDGTHLSQWGALYVTRELLEILGERFDLRIEQETP